MLWENMRKFKRFPAASLISAVLFLSNCSGPSASVPPSPTATRAIREGQLTPYVPSTSPAASPTFSVSTVTPIPTITPTPRTHVVQKGEEMLRIAFFYGLSLEDLMAANPETDPNLMSIGTVLIIPGSVETAPANAAAPAVYPTPTAIPVQTGQIQCISTREGGAWCTLPLSNPQDFALEGLTAVFRLTDRQNQATVEQSAFLPLDRILPGQSLPLTAYFPPPLPMPYEAHAEILIALPNPDDGRYLVARMNQQKVIFAENGLSAVISVNISLELPNATARQVRVAAVAYDQQDRVVGMRRWQNPDGQVLQAGQTLPVKLNIYSLLGSIQRVDLAVECRP
jgi:LysM repeat protein